MGAGRKYQRPELSSAASAVSFRFFAVIVNHIAELNSAIPEFGSCATRRNEKPVVSTADIRHHYDTFAHIYPRFWGEHIHHGLFVHGNEQPAEAQVALLEHCLELLQPRKQALVLDVGCGHGGTAVHLASTRGWRVHGFTISETQARLAMRNAARAGVSARTSFFVADANVMSLPEAKYDVVWTMECTEHLADKAAFIARAAAALRAGGQMLIAAWTGSMESARVRGVAEGFLCPSLETTDDYVQQLRSAGVRITTVEDLTVLVERTWIICRERAQAMRFVLPLMPRSVRNFVQAIDAMIDAYRSGDLRYSVIVGETHSP